MSGAHSHAAGESHERNLWWALGLTGGFLIAEIVGGILTGSLALISDALHMMTDASALAIALAAMRVGRRPPDRRRTFGYQRFEILAAAFNAVVLFLVAIYIVYEAYRRLESPAEIQTWGMVAVALVGLVVNLISMRLLRRGKDASLNVKGAYLEVWSDLLGSVGVIIGAAVIAFTGWRWFDSLIAVAIGFWVLPRTWILLKDSINILLEGVPSGIDVAAIHAAIGGLTGIREVHDLHVWAITSGNTSLSAHVVIGEDTQPDRDLVPAIRAMLRERFGIRHSTIQCEYVPCDDADGRHTFI